MREKDEQIGWELLEEDLMELIFVFDREGEVIKCSHSARYSLGYPPNTKLKSFKGIFPKLALEDTGDVAYTTDVYRNNETCFPSDVKIRECECGFIVFALDKTKLNMTARELKNIKDVLETSNKYKTEFVSNITHELRTPVNGIQGMVRTMLETELSASQRETMKIIDNCCINMSKIINNLLDFAKLELDRVILENGAFLFREFLNKTMAFNVTMINEKGLKLIMHVEDDIPEVLVGDEFRLTQILNNLIGNAVKFTSAGHIAIEVNKIREGEDYVELFFMILDTGIGIAKEDIGRLFKSFSQIDASTTRKYGGTGLGLSICKKLIEMMGGSINVKSEEGKGSVFSFNVILGKGDGLDFVSGVNFPSGNFVYEGSGRYSDSYFTDSEEKEEFTGGDFISITDKIRKFGIVNNISEIRSAMDKLLFCIELENWEKAENYSSVVKNLIHDEGEDRDLKKEAFRLELVIRREDKEKALARYREFKEKLDSVYPGSGE